jgi:two-component system, NtrC family, sensor histidine kinase HydH
MDLNEKFGMNDGERAKRLQFLDVGPKDAAQLQSINETAKLHADELIDKLYEHILSFDETKRFFTNPAVLKRVKELQKRYFIQLTEGKTDAAYFEDRLRVGDAHQRIELLPQWYLGLYSKYVGLIVEQVRKYDGDQKALETLPALMKLIFLDIGLAIDAYIDGGFIDKLRQERSVTQGLREELARKERLAILGQLAGGVGHELRNPLAVLATSVYFLRMALDDKADPKIQKHLGIVEQELANANEIITNLLDFSRVRQPERTGISLRQLVQNALERYDFGSIEVEQDIRDIEVNADPGQVRQVLINLVTNAIQAMSDTGGGRLVINTGESNGNAWIAVKDTGSGIEPAILEKIFQPLFTTKAKGIGLGLAVCESLIRANGGKITVESEPGKGSTFTIHLPMSGA